MFVKGEEVLVEPCIVLRELPNEQRVVAGRNSAQLEPALLIGEAALIEIHTEPTFGYEDRTSVHRRLTAIIKGATVDDPSLGAHNNLQRLVGLPVDVNDPVCGFLRSESDGLDVVGVCRRGRYIDAILSGPDAHRDETR